MRSLLLFLTLIPASAIAYETGVNVHLPTIAREVSLALSPSGDMADEHAASTTSAPAMERPRLVWRMTDAP